MSKFEIPQVLSGERTEDENYNAAYRAAHKHGKHLTKANADLIVAYDLAKTLKYSLDASHCDVGFTAATVVREIIKRLNKAFAGMDRHSTRHSNLFIAYFDLKGRAK